MWRWAQAVQFGGGSERSGAFVLPTTHGWDGPLINFIKRQEGVKPGSSLSERRGNIMEVGSCEILQGSDSTCLAGSCSEGGFSSCRASSRAWMLPSLPKLPGEGREEGWYRWSKFLIHLWVFLHRINYFGISFILPRKHHIAKATQSSSYPPGQQEIDFTRGTLFYQQHYWKLGRVEGPFPLFNPVCLSCFLSAERTSFLPPQRFSFKPTRTSCVDVQGQMISWSTLVLIKPNLSWQGRAAWTSIRLSTATPSSAVMSKLCNLGFDRLWGFSQWFLTSPLVPLTFQWPQYEH